MASIPMANIPFCRPLLHALVSPGVASASGIEIDRIKCNKAAAFLKHTIQELSKRNSEKAVLLPKFQCSSIEKVLYPTCLSPNSVNSVASS